LALDPSNVDALAWIAWVDSIGHAGLFSTDRAVHLASAEAAAVKVLSSAPNHPQEHFCMGWVQNFTNRASQAVAEFERALALDRNFASAHGGIGFAKIALGRSEETEAQYQEALRLSPRDPNAYLWAFFAGLAKIFLGKDGEAIAWLRRSIEFNRNYSLAHFYLAAALVLLGKHDEAPAATTVGLALDPTFTIRRVRSSASSDDPIYLAAREQAIKGMRKAGVPEESSCQLVQQRLRLFQIARIKPIREPAVDRREKLTSLIPFALIAPEPRHAYRGAEFPGLRLLPARIP
jgi:tetratricopeptide (TPR) repeat protein